MPSGTIFSFGSFQLDSRARRLLHDGEPVAIADRQLDILIAFASNPGKVLSKDALIASSRSACTGCTASFLLRRGDDAGALAL